MSKITFPLIKYKDKLGREMTWSIYVINDKIYRESQIGDGKIRIYDPIQVIPKNIGKKNETTPQEQAIAEAKSLWNKKKETTISKTIFPMLAQNFSKHSQKLKCPFAVSRKIDGIRAISQIDDDNVYITSRLGKQFIFLNTIKSELQNILKKFNVILDGEIYSHEISFNRISGAVRSAKKISKDDHLLEYWIFDIIEDELSYKDRMKKLKQIETYYKSIEYDNHLKFVYYDGVTSHDEVSVYHSKFVSEGFEGVICRNLESTYRQKFRSYDLQKYKNFEDDEFKIVNVKDGKGSENKAIIFECECENGTFDVRPRGSIEKRKEMWKNKNNFIGKMLTIRYQNTGIKDEGQMPRFPVGIEIRDYE